MTRLGEKIKSFGRPGNMSILQLGQWEAFEVGRYTGMKVVLAVLDTVLWVLCVLLILRT